MLNKVVKNSIKMIKNMKYKILILLLVVVIIIGINKIYKKDNFTVSRLNKELVFFSMEGCGYCEKFKPTWELLLNNYGDNDFIELKEVVLDKNQELVDRYNVKSFPTILYLKNGNKEKEYKGDRSYEDLVKFINYSISN